MADQSGSAHFRAIFESALLTYEKKAGVTLAEHPLAVQLQSCHSIESITAILQGKVQAFGEFRGIDRVMKSVRSTVSILTTLSTSASLGDYYGLVRQNLKALVACSTALTIFHSHFHLRPPFTLALVSYSLYVLFYIISRYPDIQVNQAAKGVKDSYDALVDLLESIEHVINRLDIYTRIPPTPTMNDIVVKILVELLSTLALATRELKKGRSSESFLADLMPF